MPVCKELVKNPRNANRCDLQRFQYLHVEGRNLIASWFRRAWSMRECADENTFEPFIYTWIAFNSWASCITGLDRDRDWLDALMLNHQIATKFTAVVNSHNGLAELVASFRETWPNFKAQELRRRGRLRHSVSLSGRTELVSEYLNAGIAHEPACWERHQNEGIEVPLDWAHTLAVLYRVRCNLFHGEKSLHSEIDKTIVSRSFRLLVEFLAESRFLD